MHYFFNGQSVVIICKILLKYPRPNQKDAVFDLVLPVKVIAKNQKTSNPLDSIYTKI